MDIQYGQHCHAVVKERAPTWPTVVCGIMCSAALANEGQEKLGDHEGGGGGAGQVPLVLAHSP